MKLPAINKPYIIRGPAAKSQGPDPTASTLISVLIVNYNGGPYLQRCLDCLARQTLPDFEAIVVDNASSDQSLARVSLPDARFRLVALDSNLGFAGANNLAASLSRSKWLATLNPDAFAEPNWLEKLAAASRQHPEAVMFGSTQVLDGAPWLLDGTGDAYLCVGMAWRGNYGRPLNRLPEKGEIFSPCGAAALYRADVFKAMDGFDPSYFCFFEDVDLGFRLRLAGHRAVYVPQAVVRHVSGGMCPRMSPLAIYLGRRNSYWTQIKNMPAVLCILFLPLHLLLEVLWVLAQALKIKLNKGGPDHDMIECLRVRRLALLHGVLHCAGVLKKRKTIQAARKVSILRIARSFCWSFVKYIKWADDVRPFKG